MTVIVHVEAVIQEDRVQDAIDFLSDKFPEARVYDGCQSVTAYLNEDGKTFVFIEHWDSKDDFNRYMTWRQESGTFNSFLEMLDGEVNIRFFSETEA